MQKLTKFKVIFDLFTVCVYFIQQQNCKLYYIYLMIISEIQSEIGHCSCDSAKFKAPADLSHHAILCMTLSLSSQLHEILPHVGIDVFTCSYRRTQLSAYRVNWIPIWKSQLFSLLMLFGGHIWQAVWAPVGLLCRSGGIWVRIGLHLPFLHIYLYLVILLANNAENV